MNNPNNKMNMEIIYKSEARLSNGVKNLSEKKGQAMLLSVILITTAVLGMASLVGSLMIYEIRYSYDVKSSAMALYAADAGIECVAYKEYVNPARVCGDPNAIPAEAPILLGNGAKFRVNYVAGVSATSVGTFGPAARQTARSFQITF